MFAILELAERGVVVPPVPFRGGLSCLEEEAAALLV